MPKSTINIKQIRISIQIISGDQPTCLYSKFSKNLSNKTNVQSEVSSEKKNSRTVFNNEKLTLEFSGNRNFLSFQLNFNMLTIAVPFFTPYDCNLGIAVSILLFWFVYNKWPFMQMLLSLSSIRINKMLFSDHKGNIRMHSNNHEFFNVSV